MNPLHALGLEPSDTVGVHAVHHELVGPAMARQTVDELVNEYPGYPDLVVLAVPPGKGEAVVEAVARALES